ncbi:hypothetical protein L3Y34_005203 [Caenorhabditis briggsae]|uniref:Uncharacterized protein n=1 Tax=Caenorhabditis briggsae TaxID=6238 RepID=A0AAE9AFP3_CAEBR|nr:hypothetical protein L3Y34_005203 [Caenorhabditis briggsae]
MSGPSQDLPPYFLFDNQRNLRFKAKKIIKFQLCTDIIFGILASILYIVVFWFLSCSRLPCPPPTSSCENSNHNQSFVTASRDRTTIIDLKQNVLFFYQPSMTLRAIFIATNGLLFGFFEELKNQRNRMARSVIRFITISRFLSGLLDLFMISRVQYLLNSLPATLPWILFAWPLAQFFYVLDSVWGYKKVIGVLLKCERFEDIEQMAIENMNDG